MAGQGSSIEGRWRIAETQLWDREALDLVVPAHITLGREGLGDMQLIAIGASIDYRVEERAGILVLEFSWSGFDDRDAASGRGCARIDGDTMHGRLFIHQGDESTFLARRELGARSGSAPKGSLPAARSAVARAQRARPRQRGVRDRARTMGRETREAPESMVPVTGGGESRARDRALVYQFKVALLEVAPPVWRTIQVPATYSFWDLHVALQDSMGWLDSHLHLFRLKRPGTRDVAQIGIPDEDAFEGDEAILPGWEVPIAGYFGRPGTVAQYDYDFGDGWEHAVTLEAILPRQNGMRYPRCLAGERACPPEDCGGVPGYENLMAVMGDPTHEEYESTLQWLGGRFDLERFDAKKVTFDHPGKRWDLAFGKAAQTRGRGGRRSPRRR